MSKTLNTLAAGLVASAAAFAAPSANAADIITTAAEAGTFNTLLEAAQASGVDILLGFEGPFTVFAPTDEAFAALPAGTVETLLQPENRYDLAAILKYHILPQELTFTDVSSISDRFLTYEGSWLDVNGITGQGFYVGSTATVVTPDIETDNGVIHVIDQVLIP